MSHIHPGIVCQSTCVNRDHQTIDIYVIKRRRDQSNEQFYDVISPVRARSIDRRTIDCKKPMSILRLNESDAKILVPMIFVRRVSIDKDQFFTCYSRYWRLNLSLSLRSQLKCRFRSVRGRLSCPTANETRHRR